jgi:methionyl-tRNA formyltransferase
MKVVFMGTPEFARKPLADLRQSDHNILAVVTGMDKETGRGRRLTASPCKIEAEAHGIPVYTPKSLKDEQLHRELDALKPDLFVVVAFRILPERLFSLPKFGSINVHASLLPRYRGAAPINWVLINGEHETGLTSFFLGRKVDTGDIICQQPEPIHESDNYDSLYNRLSEAAGPFLLKTLELIENGTADPTRQDDLEASPAPKLTPADALIKFDLPAEKVRNFVRGMSTRPGAYSYLRGKKIKVYECAVASETGAPDVSPGTVLVGRKKLIVQCDNSSVELLRIVPQGKKEMDGRSFVNGIKPQVGERFEPVWDETERKL